MQIHFCQKQIISAMLPLQLTEQGAVTIMGHSVLLIWPSGNPYHCLTRFFLMLPVSAGQMIIQDTMQAVPIAII